MKGLLLLITLGLLLVKDVAASAIMKRSTHKEFPDYSLRYKHPELCNTAGTGNQTSGYFELPNEKNFFFLLTESNRNPSKDPTLLWVNGGPGCSSMMGLFMGIGPCRVNNKGDGLLPNPHSWSNAANIIYLDQPVNSGYSYQKNKTLHILDSNTAAEDIYIFLQLFFHEFSQFTGSDFHVAGESCNVVQAKRKPSLTKAYIDAGHFLPAIATSIQQGNANGLYEKINLKSIMIGNGLTDPLTQYQYYKSMACEKSAYGVLESSSKKCNELELQQKECNKLIKNCYQKTDFTQTPATADSINACVMASKVCNALVIKPVIDSTKLNTYDVRRKCEDGPLCYDYFSAVKSYLDRADVKASLGVEASLKFELCNSMVNADFQTSGDWMRPYISQITPLLNSNISVLAYAGDADFMCNWMGIRAWTMAMPWSHKEAYNRQQDAEWRSNNKIAGTLRKEGNLAFLRLFDAGHMAPYDQPEVTLDMFSKWISDNL